MIVCFCCFDEDGPWGIWYGDIACEDCLDLLRAEPTPGNGNHLTRCPGGPGKPSNVSTVTEWHYLKPLGRRQPLRRRTLPHPRQPLTATTRQENR